MHGDFASVGATGLSIEVPFVFDRQDPHALCVHEIFFKAQFEKTFLGGQSAAEAK
jgi:hypothetical protein